MRQENLPVTLYVKRDNGFHFAGTVTMTWDEYDAWTTGKMKGTKASQLFTTEQRAALNVQPDEELCFV